MRKILLDFVFLAAALAGGVAVVIEQRLAPVPISRAPQPALALRLPAPRHCTHEPFAILR
jgi:hypothetical protein